MYSNSPAFQKNISCGNFRPTIVAFLGKKISWELQWILAEYVPIILDFLEYLKNNNPGFSFETLNLQPIIPDF